MEYRVLIVIYKARRFKFYILGLLSERVRWITNLTHSPNNVRSPVYLNGILHWMVNDKSYKHANGDNPGCSSSIMLFNTTSEEFSTIPHPGDECGLRKKHDMMELMDMEGNLSLCDSRSFRYLDIWMLEDYENWFWGKRHSIEIEPLLEFCGIQYRYGSHVNLGGFYMYNKELLLKVCDNDLILYNQQTGSIRRVGKQMRKDMRVVAVPHINTLFIDIF
ncbi:hypothetical protein FRX31_029499 [Thalictrum thalictroides]|uniref:F-box associated beta-propeller type 3 domain-containing protein n=1 Tax=Thalictrum thalictroides TaxID=46969 RepID=A0A7J6V711_THATH|nr:hypothetical protein FRX31_029499 [Thalictrum thalictroides]